MITISRDELKTLITDALRTTVKYHAVHIVDMVQGFQWKGGCTRKDLNSIGTFVSRKKSNACVRYTPTQAQLDRVWRLLKALCPARGHDKDGQLLLGTPNITED